MIDIVVEKSSFDGIENFDALSREHWMEFNDREPKFNKQYFSICNVITAKKGVETIGYVFYFVVPSPCYNEIWCNVDMFFLKKQFRKNGVGKKMFALLEQQAKEHGCKRILSSFNLKGPLEDFYGKLGFKPTHVAVSKEI